MPSGKQLNTFLKKMTKNNKLDQKVSNDKTIVKEFKPTPHMIVWLDTQARIQTDVIEEIARESSIAKSTWYEWLKNPQFEDWYWAEYDRRTRRWKPTVDAIGLKFAKRGSAEHFKYLAQRVGNVREQGNTNIQINVTPIVDDPIYVQEDDSNKKDI